MVDVDTTTNVFSFIDNFLPGVCYRMVFHGQLNRERISDSSHRMSASTATAGGVLRPVRQ